jgi:hypothetical protein
MQKAGWPINVCKPRHDPAVGDGILGQGHCFKELGYRMGIGSAE